MYSKKSVNEFAVDEGAVLMNNRNKSIPQQPKLSVRYFTQINTDKGDESSDNFIVMLQNASYKNQAVAVYDNWLELNM